MKLNPAAILFDMDGVLVDSLDSWWESLNAALKAFNIKEISRDEFIEKYWGHDLQYNMKKMGISYKVITFCNNVYAQHVNVIKVYPDTKDTLSKLNKYRKGVITNTPRDCAVQILKKYKLKDYFDIILTSDDVKNGKPDPELVLKACSLLNVKPSEVVLVGDTKSDIHAGKAAGCKVIGKKIKADYTINELSDLTKLIYLNK